QLIGTSFFNVAEFNNFLKPIVRFYLAYFGRPPQGTSDYANLQAFLKQYRASFTQPTLRTIASNFETTEFDNQYLGDSTDSAFVTHVFQNLLGRVPNANELSTYTMELTPGGKSRGDVAFDISTSPNTQFPQLEPKVFVIMMYVGMLRRSPAASGYSFWV